MQIFVKITKIKSYENYNNINTGKVEDKKLFIFDYSQIRRNIKNEDKCGSLLFRNCDGAKKATIYPQVMFKQQHRKKWIVLRIHNP